MLTSCGLLAYTAWTRPPRTTTIILFSILNRSIFVRQHYRHYGSSIISGAAYDLQCMLFLAQRYTDSEQYCRRIYLLYLTVDGHEADIPYSCPVFLSRFFMGILNESPYRGGTGYGMLE